MICCFSSACRNCGCHWSVASTYQRNHDHSWFLHADGSVNVSEFFNAAADFCNGQVFGTLSCSMSIHPSTQRKHRRTFEKFLADLKYGNIVVNAATSLGFCFCPLPWGAWAAAGVGQRLCTVHSLSGGSPVQLAFQITCHRRLHHFVLSAENALHRGSVL